MSFVISILYGLLSGIAEFFPISSRAHQTLLLRLSGQITRDPLQDLLVHIAVLLAVMFFGRSVFLQLRAGRNRRSRHRQGRLPVKRTTYDSRLIRTAAVPLFIGSLSYAATIKMEGNLPLLAVFLLVNGLVLLVTEHVRHGNRDASTMTGLDGIMMGICGALAAFPGISRTGLITTYATCRGADYHHSVNWAVVLAVPALVVTIILDVIFIASVGVVGLTFSRFVGYFLGAVAAFGGTYVGITFLRIILGRSGFSGFAYYSLGAALFSLVLYLIVW